MVALVAAAHAHAGPRMNTAGSVVEIPAPENMVLVAAPQERCIAVSDALSLLVVACHDGKDAYLLAFPLDAQGNLGDAEPTRTDMPRAESLGVFISYPLDIAFHPGKPLLYVWQDMRGPRENHPPRDMIFRDLRHLLVYRIEDGSPKLQAHLASGISYAFGMREGNLGIDIANKRLYVPNTQRIFEEDKRYFEVMVGYIELDDEGMPLMEDGRERLVRHKANVRYRCYGLDPAAGYHLFPDGQSGMLPVTGDMVMYTDKHDLVTTNMNPAKARKLKLPLSISMPFFPLYWFSWTRCVAHPVLQVVYATSGGSVLRVEHVDGYPTLMPQRVFVNETVRSSPVAIEQQGDRPGCIAVSGGQAVLLFNIDKQGYLTGTVEKIPVNHWVQSLAYSRKFDKLYVPVDKLPEQASDK